MLNLARKENLGNCLMKYCFNNHETFLSSFKEKFLELIYFTTCKMRFPSSFYIWDALKCKLSLAKIVNLKFSNIDCNKFYIE